MNFAGEKFLEKLKSRRKESHAYKRFQFMGLQLADLLGDKKHKALYIKLAKERDSENLLFLAKQVAERENIRNKGAYFMSCLLKRRHLRKYGKGKV